MTGTFSVRGLLLGERLETRGLERSLRLEWYIIGLIGLELLLSLYGRIFGGLPFAASAAR